MTPTEYRLEARTALRGKWGLAAVTTLVAALLGGVSTSGSIEIEFRQQTQVSEEVLMEMMPYILLGVAASIISSLFLGNVISMGYKRFCLNLTYQTDAGFEDIFSQFREGRYLPTVKLQALRELIIFAWSLLFLIPGIIAGYSYSMASYIQIDHPYLSASQCLTASKRLMDGRKIDLFVLQLSFIGWSILSSFTFGIGGLFLTPYQETAEAAFYRDLTDHIQIADYI